MNRVDVCWGLASRALSLYLGGLENTELLIDFPDCGENKRLSYPVARSFVTLHLVCLA